MSELKKKAISIFIYFMQIERYITCAIYKLKLHSPMFCGFFHFSEINYSQKYVILIMIIDFTCEVTVK